MSMQQTISPSGSRFPPAVYQEFIPAALRHPNPRLTRANFPSGGHPVRPPRFYYSRPLAPQYMPPRPRFGNVHSFMPGPMIPSPQKVETPKNCICERPEMTIICQRCGSELFGRIQRQCPAHPKSIQLMDHRECANKFCRSIQLVEVATTEVNRV
uniref:Uncharacterized protein n=1 Tax=Panagrolaimus sp. JU765 TaxID=591449 RepID=A0AC34Q5L5_9BILA